MWEVCEYDKEKEFHSEKIIMKQMCSDITLRKNMCGVIILTKILIN